MKTKKGSRRTVRRAYADQSKLSGMNLAALDLFLKGPKPRHKFLGLGSALRMEMEQMVNRGPTPDKLQKFVKGLREGRHTPPPTITIGENGASSTSLG